MAEQPDTFWYCLRCGAENEAAAKFCHDCGAALNEQRGHDRQGGAFLLNALHALQRAGLITIQQMKALQAMVGFRNILVHNYQKLNLDIMVEVIEHHLQDLLDFANAALEAAD